jgi:hypothetical protein
MPWKKGWNLRERKAEIRTGRKEVTARVEAKIAVNNEKFETLRGILPFRMDIHQARTKSTPEEMKAKMDMHQEKKWRPQYTPFGPS